VEKYEHFEKQVQHYIMQKLSFENPFSIGRSFISLPEK
jgi:hypothetical protein